MNITFLGGAGEYGRSCFLLHVNNNKLLIDCGVMKSGKILVEQYPRLTSELARDIKAVFLTHAHEDHTGALPYLVHLGFKGNVFATEETIKQTAYYLKSWRETQLQTVGELPYTKKDESSLSFKTFDQWDEGIIPGFTFSYGKSGHLPGSIWYLFRFQGNSVYFSGDFSMESQILQFDYPKIEAPVDLAVMDGAYGVENRKQQEFCEVIFDRIQTAREKNDSVIIIVPPYGRSHDLLFLLKEFLMTTSSPLLLDNQILYAAEGYAESKVWFKADIFEEYLSLLSHLERKRTDRPNAPFIAFYSERSLLSDKWWLCEKGKIHFIFTGPNNEQLVDTITEKQEGSYTITKAGYKVHPAVYETEKLMRLLKPKQTLLTHSPKELCDPLAKELSSLTGLNVMPATPNLG